MHTMVHVVSFLVVVLLVLEFGWSPSLGSFLPSLGPFFAATLPHFAYYLGPFLPTGVLSSGMPVFYLNYFRELVILIIFVHLYLRGSYCYVITIPIRCT